MSIVNLILWLVLFVAWIPYALLVGIADPVSVHVMVILALTAVLMLALGAFRRSRHRHVLG